MCLYNVNVCPLYIWVQADGTRIDRPQQSDHVKGCFVADTICFYFGLFSAAITIQNQPDTLLPPSETDTNCMEPFCNNKTKMNDFQESAECCSPGSWPPLSGPFWGSPSGAELMNATVTLRHRVLWGVELVGSRHRPSHPALCGQTQRSKILNIKNK